MTVDGIAVKGDLLDVGSEEQRRWSGGRAAGGRIRAAPPRGRRRGSQAVLQARATAGKLASAGRSSSTSLALGSVDVIIAGALVPFVNLLRDKDVLKLG